MTTAEEEARRAAVAGLTRTTALLTLYPDAAARAVAAASLLDDLTGNDRLLLAIADAAVARALAEAPPRCASCGREVRGPRATGPHVLCPACAGPDEEHDPYRVCPHGDPGCDAPDDGEWHCHDSCQTPDAAPETPVLRSV